MASAQVSYLQRGDVMLDGKNYKAWSSTLRVLLRGLNLWGHVDGTRPPPVSSTAASSTSSSSTDIGASSSPSADLLKWTEDDARTIAIICQSCELPIRLVVCDFPTAKAIWDHLRALYLLSSQALRYSLLQTLTSTYQRESSVSDFFAVLSDLWRQCDEMAPSPSPTCARCLAIAQDRDYLRIYEFLMRLRPEFEAVRAQLLHRVTPPSASDTLAYVLAEETRLRSLDVVPPPAAPHSVLAAPQQNTVPTIAPLMPSPGLIAPVHSHSQSPGQGSTASHRRSVRCHYCHALGHVRIECRKLQRAQLTAQQRTTTTPSSTPQDGPLSAEQFQQLIQQLSRNQISRSSAPALTQDASDVSTHPSVASAPTGSSYRDPHWSWPSP